MLESLKFNGVGPAPKLEVAFKPRMNFLLGDNGVGKTFILDTAWWALTRTWARGAVIPMRPPVEASIEYQYTTKTAGSHSHISVFDRGREEWPLKKGRPPIPGLVIYAQVDGGFSVWDPARNYWKGEIADRQSAYLFSPQEVWDGLPLNEPVKFCNGLIADWTNWKLEDGETFQQLVRVLRALAPSEEEPLEPGGLVKVSLNDSRRHPTIRMPYGEIPLIHAAAGLRRIATLAYLLVWTWHEHIESAQLRGEEPAKEIVFLIDEIEGHLHPQWQRRIVPALLGVMDALTGSGGVPVQLISATHSPLVLASIEPQFDERRDGLFLLDIKGGKVSLREEPWAKQGDVVGWLVSESFGLRQGRSLEAERAIEAAEAWMRGDVEGLPAALSSQVTIDAELKRVLAGQDPFWPRWVVAVERQGDAG